MHRYAKRVASITLVIISAIMLAACGRGPGIPTDGKDNSSAAAATVNGKNISLSEVDTLIAQQAGGQQTAMSPLERATARLQVLDGLIQQEVLFQRADKEKLLPSEDEVTQAINGKKREANMSEEDYQKMLKESGQTEPQLREVARKQLSIQKLLEKTVSNVTVRDNEVDAFYNANKERFVSPRGVVLSAIFADSLDGAGQFPNDAKSDLEAKTKIDTVNAQLRGGADFATVARQQSEDQSFIRGGDYGFWDEARLKQGGLPAEVVSNLFGSMRPGDLTAPIRLDDGRYVILKLTDRRLQNEPQTLETPGVRDQIKKALVDERQKVLGAAMRVVAISEAKIENHLAQSMLKDPSMLGGMQPVNPGTATTPAAPAAATPAATATPAAPASPSSTASPQGTK
ncbi:MAG: SurA N-terminal domain-containing protein [Acidobacteria bacterium]|nr:SurA N-terminal domain-containing protein [Acidobacteriota bacterium]